MKKEERKPLTELANDLFFPLLKHLLRREKKKILIFLFFKTHPSLLNFLFFGKY